MLVTRSAMACSHGVCARMMRRSIKPTRQRRISPARRPTPGQQHEHRLRNVLGKMRISKTPATGVIDDPRVPPDQRGEGVLRAARAVPLEQLPVVLRVVWHVYL
jgi:hypothetical protein